MDGAEGEVVVVLVTAPDEAVARRIAEGLVEGRLAACVNLVPGIRSIYRWEGALQDDREMLMLIKTASERLDALTARVHELHPYDLPEVLALPAVGGSLPYLAGVRSESSP
jgi:periplasmic divalent cation tolerance protein